MPNFTVEQLHKCMQNSKNVRNISVIAHVDHGKCFAKDTEFIMFDGSKKYVQDVQVGDLLMGDDSTPRIIQSLARGRDQLYRIESTDGQVSYTVNSEHILCLKTTGGTSRVLKHSKRKVWQVEWLEKPDFKNCCKTFKEEKEAKEHFANILKLPTTAKKGDILEISVKNFLQKSKYFQSYFYGFISKTNAWKARKVKLDPYDLGIWLGGGTSASSEITNVDEAILSYFGSKYTLKKKSSAYDQYSYYVKAKNDGINPFLEGLKTYGLINNKHIPKDYYVNSRENRLKLLAGIIDSNGCATVDNRYEITFKNERLADDTIELCRSLGFKTNKYEAWKKSQTMKKKQKYCRFFVGGKQLHQIPVLLQHKKCTKNASTYSLDVYGIRIIPVGMGDYYGFMIDGNQRFLLSNYTVVHNSTLTDSLLSTAGIIASKDAGDKRETDTKSLEKEKGITIVSTGVSLYHEMKMQEDEKEQGFLINVIDSPGHVDFSSEVTAALRVTDGALVVVDCIEGVCVQTETVLRQAMGERIKPILMINKIDRLMLEKKMQGEEIYQCFNKAIESVNVVIATYEGERENSLCVSPEKGTVAFGSGKYGWAFSLSTFAKVYAKLTKMPVEKLTKRLWGGWYWDEQKKKFTKKSNDGANKRTFVKFILEPIIEITEILRNNDQITFDDAVKKLVHPIAKRDIGNLKLHSEDKKKTGIELWKRALMRKWLPAGPIMLDMIIRKLPSPKEAQEYRTETLYQGSMNDECAVAMKACDPDGPLMVYISKMVPTADKSRCYAFGRVFSGTVKSGQKVNIMGSDYNPITKTGQIHRNVVVQRTTIMMCAKTLAIDSCPAGNTVALVGIDKNLSKSGTLSTHPDAFPLRGMKFSVSPVVKVAVEPKKITELPKFNEGLKKLAKIDGLCQVTPNETGQVVVAGAGELHLQVIMEDLRRDYCPGIEFNVSEPVVNFRETVTDTSSLVCMTKSPNKHNRFYAKAQPLSEGFVESVENSEMPVNADNKTLARYITDKFDWDPNSAKKIWAFGPEGDVACNVLVDETKGVQYMHEIRDSCKNAFNWVTSDGALCNEKMRGCRFNLLDPVLHADAIHRGGGQVIGAVRNLLYAAELSAKPSLMEPIYLAEIQAPQNVVGTIYNFISKKRGRIFDERNVYGTPIYNLKAFLPVMESFGFNADLKSATGGQAFPQLFFDHWEIIPGDYLDENSKLFQIVTDIRKRKGMDPKIPEFTKYMDRL